MTPATLASIHARSFITPRPWTEAELTALLADSASFLITSETGFLLGRQVLDEAEILTIAVDPENRRGGQGLDLIGQFEDAARQRGATTALLEVAIDNVAARNLYLRCGYLLSGRRPGYYRTPDGSLIDAEIMCKQLV